MASNYVRSMRRPPRTLTDAEQARILKVTGQHRDNYRDHVIISLALGSAMRESEIAALNVGDIIDMTGAVRRRIRLSVFKGSFKGPAKVRTHGGLGPRGQEIFFPDTVHYKLTQFLKWKRKEGEPTDVDAPVFATLRKTRIATRTIRHLFRQWQKTAHFDQLYPFHSLRHSSGTNVYRATGDVRMAQRHLRHTNLSTTQIYTHVSDEDLYQAVRKLPS